LETIVGLVVMLMVPIYPVAQVLALIRWRGWALWLALVPIPVMGLAVYLLIIGLREQSNLAPIFVILAAPPCLLWLGIIHLLRR
jgi:hypothetical protein